MSLWALTCFRGNFLHNGCKPQGFMVGLYVNFGAVGVLSLVPQQQKKISYTFNTDHKYCGLKVWDIYLQIKEWGINDFFKKRKSHLKIHNISLILTGSSHELCARPQNRYNHLLTVAFWPRGITIYKWWVCGLSIRWITYGWAHIWDNCYFHGPSLYHLQSNTWASSSKGAAVRLLVWEAT